MSNTIADKLVVLSDGLELIDQERQYQTDLILNLQDSLERLSTPIPQSAPLITIDDTTGIVTASVTQEQGGYIAPGTLQTQVEAKYHSQNLLPQNIKSGVKILGVTGTMSSGIDTSDATARPEYIRSGSTAYVNGQKITGTADADTSFFHLGGIDPDSASEIDFYLSLDPNKTYLLEGGFNPAVRVPLEVFGDATAANVRKNKTFTSSSGYSVTGTMPDVTHAKPSISVNDANGIVTASHTTAAGYTDAGTTSNTLQLSVQGATTITPSALEQTAVAAGFYTKGAVKVAGDADLKAANIRNGVSIFNVTGTYTSDATADATHILKDKIAYSKGSKITGTMANNGTVSPAALSAGGSYTIPAGYHSGSGKVTTKTLAEQTSANAAASNILINKTAWVGGTKVTGTMADNGAVSPAALNAGGSYTIPAGYHNGSGKITAASLAGQTSGTAAASHILEGKTAWVNGTKITGTMTDHGAVAMALALGGTYTIPAGYHSGSGKVTTQSLSSQTPGTAAAADIVKGKTAWVSGSKVTGSMPTIDAIAIRGASTYNQDDESIECCGTSERVGYLDGSTAVLVSCNSEQFGDAAMTHVLAGKTFTSTAGLKVTGAMTNQGAKTATLNAGGSYTIPAGYHNGSGKVTANSLASQTSGSAAANEILSGETAWVNGTKITGSLKKMTASIDEASDILYITIA